jgi:hypothetical protein
MLHSSPGVSLACVALELEGLPGVWKARSPQMLDEMELMGGLRAARAPPRGRFVYSGPHMVVLMV